MSHKISLPSTTIHRTVVRTEYDNADTVLSAVPGTVNHPISFSYCVSIAAQLQMQLHGTRTHRKAPLVYGKCQHSSDRAH
jgi:hypothetical protein